MAETPLMKQYKEIKSEHEDSILFFRLGDFYEMFFDDAVKASKELGLTRVVLAREVSMEELAEIRKRTDVEIEAFVHGAMCISYSGRCTLSNHMSMRDANRGGCSQSCRWKYDLYDMPFGKERKSLKGEIPEEFSMSAVDMSMIDHIPDMIENGVDSLKIEGRMKSIHYVSTVTNCYKAAVESLSRAFNLAEKADASVAVDASLFENDQEKALAKAIEELELTGSASDKLTQLFALSPVIDAFFDNTMVMAEDIDVKNNRLAILTELVNKAKTVAAFNLLNTKYAYMTKNALKHHYNALKEANMNYNKLTLRISCDEMSIKTLEKRNYAIITERVNIQRIIEDKIKVEQEYNSLDKDRVALSRIRTIMEGKTTVIKVFYFKPYKKASV